jgi:uncharacterized membrane protein
MENLPFKESDLASFAGLIVVIPILVGALKKLFTAWIAGREPMLCVVLTYAVGITAKLTVPHAFGGVGWLTLGIGLLLSSVASMNVHDSFINRVLKGKDEPPK